MFLKLDSKDKFLFILHKAIILIGIAIAIFAAFKVSNINLETVDDKIGAGIGFSIIIVIGILAYFNRLKSLFKVKFMGFLIVFLVALLIKNAIDPVIYATGFITIPLAIDDIFIGAFWKYRMFRKYEEV